MPQLILSVLASRVDTDVGGRQPREDGGGASADSEARAHHDARRHGRCNLPPTASLRPRSNSPSLLRLKVSSLGAGHAGPRRGVQGIARVVLHCKVTQHKQSTSNA
eukprot:3940998-Rhodomonas_salina.7